MTPTPQIEIEEDLTSLLLEARNGNQQAWMKLFQDCYPKVRRVVRRRMDRSMRTIFDSTDFANEAMNELAAHLHQLDFPTEGSLVAFLAKVARQKVIDEHRRQQAAKRKSDQVCSLSTGNEENNGMIQVASDSPTASKFAVAVEEQERIMAALDETGRQAFELRTMGYTNQDIAERTGWTLRTVQRFFQELRHALTVSGD